MISGRFPQDNPGSGVKEGTEWGSSPRKQLRASLSPLHPSGVPECTVEGRRGVSGGGMGGERRSLGSFRQGVRNYFKSQLCFLKNKTKREFPGCPLGTTLFSHCTWHRLHPWLGI